MFPKCIFLDITRAKIQYHIDLDELQLMVFHGVIFPTTDRINQHLEYTEYPAFDTVIFGILYDVIPDYI